MHRATPWWARPETHLVGPLAGVLLERLFGEDAQISNSPVRLVFTVHEHRALREVPLRILLLLRDTTRIFRLLDLQTLQRRLLLLHLCLQLLDIFLRFCETFRRELDQEKEEESAKSCLPWSFFCNPSIVLLSDFSSRFRASRSSAADASPTSASPSFSILLRSSSCRRRKLSLSSISSMFLRLPS